MLILRQDRLETGDSGKRSRLIVSRSSSARMALSSSVSSGGGIGGLIWRPMRLGRDAVNFSVNFS
jgi:hypothetical protein